MLHGIGRVGIASRHKRHKVRQFVLAIRKRIGRRLRLDLQIGEVGRRMLEPYVAGKREFFGACIKAGDGTKIAKKRRAAGVFSSVRASLLACLQPPQVMRVARSKHHAVVAKTDRHAVTIDRDMPHRENRHLI